MVVPCFARGPSSSTVASAVNVANLATPIFALGHKQDDRLVHRAGGHGVRQHGDHHHHSAHGLSAGELVTIAGFSGSYTGYNGTFTIAHRAHHHHLHLHRLGHRPGQFRRRDGDRRRAARVGQHGDGGHHRGQRPGGRPSADDHRRQRHGVQRGRCHGARVLSSTTFTYYDAEPRVWPIRAAARRCWTAAFRFRSAGPRPG